MLSMKLLLTFSLLTGIVAEECTTDLGIDDFTDKVLVTNATAAETAVDAIVNVRFDRGRVSLTIPPGKTRTAVGIASTRYTVMVAAPSAPSRETYLRRLLGLRDDLQELSLSGYIGPNSLVQLFTELSDVQAALDQLSLSGDFQSCTGTIDAAPSKVTLQWKKPLDDVGIWVLDCG